MKRTRSCFTLIELLVVIAIISLLVSILIPSLYRAKVLARRSVCQGNLNGAGRGLHQYAVDNNSFFPTKGFTASTRFDYIGDRVTLDVTTNDPNAGNSRNLYVGVRAGALTPLQLICPATTDTPASPSNYDFENRNRLSYSYHLEFAGTTGHLLTLTSEPGQAVLADRNPLVLYDANGTQSTGQTQPTSPPTGADPTTFMNSFNHGQEGQNVLLADGHSEWATSAVPAGGSDNMYTAWDGTNHAVGQMQLNMMPGGDADAVLVP